MKIESYKKKDGKTYYCLKAYISTDRRGKKKEVTRSGFATRKAAEIAYLELVNTAAPIRGGKLKFEHVLEEWLSVYAPTVAPSTLKKTRGYAHNHFLPALEGYLIEAITLKDLQDFITDTSQKTTKASEFKSYLVRIFDFAIRMGYIKDNPAKHIQVPRKKPKEESTNFLSGEELRVVLERMGNDMLRAWEVFFRLLAHTGMRRGEAMALTWEDINFKKSLLTINKSLAVSDEGVYVSGGKTKSARRTITLDRDILSVLRAWKLECGSAALLFPSGNGSHRALSHAGCILASFFDRNPDLKRITPHGFRHTHCVLLFEAGASIAQVQARLGHTDIKTTLQIYNHVTAKKEKETAEIFLKAIGTR